ncbi:MAG: signal peptidase I, partial [Ruminococcus sp.]|nr:signal peptidase I [Ruminococcus sp.]
YSHPIIKRVIAIGGQTVKLDYENDKIFVDGAELTEDYIKGTTFSNNGNKDSKYLEPDESGNFVIPEGKLFVLGDNRAVSLDSRSPEIGLIDVKDVIGKAQFVVFPFNRFGNVYDK